MMVVVVVCGCVAVRVEEGREPDDEDTAAHARYLEPHVHLVFELREENLGKCYVEEDTSS